MPQPEVLHLLAFAPVLACTVLPAGVRQPAQLFDDDSDGGFVHENGFWLNFCEAASADPSFASEQAIGLPVLRAR